MPTLLPVGTVLDATNNTGVCYKNLIRSDSALDIANESAQAILSALATDLASSDPAHFAVLVPFVTGIYGAAPGTTTTSPFGAVMGIGPGSFGTGQGLINRASILSGGFFAWLEALRKDMATYGSAQSIVDLSTYAAYQNGLSAYSCLYTPDFATLFWYAYNRSQQLAAASVFAPEGIVLAGFRTTAANAGTFTPGSFPTVNGYSVAPVGAPCGVVTITGADAASLASAASGANNAVAYVSTAVNGTATITVTADNQNSVAATFTAVVDNLSAGSMAAFTPANAQDVMVGAPSAASVAGTATAGVVQIVEGGPSVDGYGNAVWIGGLPMAQGFAPLDNAVAAVTETFNGTAVVTITAPDAGSANALKTWTATLSSEAEGYSVGLSLGTAVGRMNGPPTSITIAGTATVGEFQVQSGAPERGY